VGGHWVRGRERAVGLRLVGVLPLMQGRVWGRGQVGRQGEEVKRSLKGLRL